MKKLRNRVTKRAKHWYRCSLAVANGPQSGPCIFHAEKPYIQASEQYIQVRDT